MAKIGDLSYFSNKGSITVFAGVYLIVNESKSYKQKCILTYKRGYSNFIKTFILGNGYFN